jgi:hypothetical protein
LCFVCHIHWLGIFQIRKTKRQLECVSSHCLSMHSDHRFFLLFLLLPIFVLHPVGDAYALWYALVFGCTMLYFWSSRSSNADVGAASDAAEYLMSELGCASCAHGATGWCYFWMASPYRGACCSVDHDVGGKYYRGLAIENHRRQRVTKALCSASQARFTWGQVLNAPARPSWICCLPLTVSFDRSELDAGGYSMHLGIIPRHSQLRKCTGCRIWISLGVTPEDEGTCVEPPWQDEASETETRHTLGGPFRLWHSGSNPYS